MFLKKARFFVLSFLIFHFMGITEETAQQKSETLYDSGFWFKGDDHHLRIGGLIQVDGRFFLNSDAGDSTFLIRRARLFASGVIDELYGYMLMARWDKQKPDIQYAWLETLKPTHSRFRAGLFKEPFSLERLYSSAYWDFNERSLVVANYTHGEDLGVMVFGKTEEDFLEYGVGIFNGRGRKLDNNQNKEFVGRFVLRPFDYCLFEKLYFGFSFSLGKQKEKLEDESFKTGVDTPFWKWADDTKVNACKNRFGADVEWLLGPMAFRAEFLYVDWGKIRLDLNSKKFTGFGWYCEGSYLLTGETKPRNKALIPFNNFNYLKCTWGAWEIAGRYELFYARDLIHDGFATGANQVHSFTLGVNCYMNRFMVARLDWQRFFFNRRICVYSHRVPQETVIIARLQAEF